MNTRTSRQGSRELAIAYLRVVAGDAKAALKFQRILIEAWALSHGLNIVEWCTQEDLGNDDPLTSPGLELSRALALLRAHRAGALLVAARDHISPDAIVFATVVKMAADLGAQVIPVTEESVGQMNDPEADRVVKKVFESYERTVLLVARARKAMAAVSAQRGRAGVPPWGYRPGKDGQGWVPHTEEQRVLALVRKLRKQGATFASIATSLASAGFTTRTGRPFTTAGVHRMARRAEPQPDAE